MKGRINNSTFFHVEIDLIKALKKLQNMFLMAFELSCMRTGHYFKLVLLNQ